MIIDGKSTDEIVSGMVKSGLVQFAGPPERRSRQIKSDAEILAYEEERLAVQRELMRRHRLAKKRTPLAMMECAGMDWQRRATQSIKSANIP